MGIKRFAGAVVLLGGALLLVFADGVRRGVTDALLLAVKTVVPGLFPFLILSEFACGAGLLQPHGARTDRLMRTLFGVPAQGLPCLLFGWTGGYPVGVKTAAALLENGKINAADAKKLACFCQSPGVAFTLAAVGAGMYGSMGVGAVLFASVTAANLVCALLRRGDRSVAAPCSALQPEDKNLAEVFVEAVRRASVGILSVTAWIAAFAAFSAVLNAILPPAVAGYAALLTEVTTACCTLAGTGDFALTAAVLGFGGLCVICQLLPDLHKIGLPVSVFLRRRLLNAALSWGFCRALLPLLPAELAVSTSAPTVRLFSTTPAASVLLLFACIIFILDLAPYKNMWYNKRIKMSGR